MTSEIRKAFLSDNLSEQKDWVVFARNSEAGHSRPEHVHDVAQLLYAESGVMLLVSDGIPRLVPPDRKSTRLNSSHPSSSRMPSSA